MDKQFWDKRYEDQNIGWDLGEVSPPLKTFFDQLENKNVKILIPGSGSSYEVQYLWENGFQNVFAMDISQHALDRLKKNCPSFPNSNMILGDFFGLDDQFDFIVEQTFFCALLPDLRGKYVQKLKELLKPDGEVFGLLFNRNFEGGPPFGGSKDEYLNLFSELFDVVKLENCMNSVEPRMGSELFFHLKMKP